MEIPMCSSCSKVQINWYPSLRTKLIFSLLILLPEASWKISQGVISSWTDLMSLILTYTWTCIQKHAYSVTLPLSSLQPFFIPFHFPDLQPRWIPECGSLVKEVNSSCRNRSIPFGHRSSHSIRKNVKIMGPLFRWGQLRASKSAWSSTNPPTFAFQLTS